MLDYDIHRIVRYVCGNGSPEERAADASWIALDRERQTLADEIQRILASSPASLPRSDTSQALERFRQSVDWEPAGVPAAASRMEPAAQGSAPPGRARRPARWSWAMDPAAGSVRSRALRAAAFLASAACLAVFIAGVDRWWDRARVPSPAASFHEYATAVGERSTIMLGDGTQLALAPASRLRIADTFGRDRRDVYLEGEAVFSVTHDERRPFAVHVGRSVATDVGTRFDVRGYVTDSRVRVVVAEGAVSFRADSATPEIPLHPGDLAVVDAAGRTRLTRSVDAADYMDWSNGRLKFVDTPLDDALADVGRWYGLDVRLADPGQSVHRLNATFVNKPIIGVLDAVAAATGLSYSRSGRTVVFTAHAGS